MKWEILKSDYVLKTKWLTVRKDKVRMPSGVEMDDYYVLEYPDWVNMIGFYNILEACRHNPVEHLVYASSSSVYGGNKKVPFA